MEGRVGQVELQVENSTVHLYYFPSFSYAATDIFIKYKLCQSTIAFRWERDSVYSPQKKTHKSNLSAFTIITKDR